VVVGAALPAAAPSRRHHRLLLGQTRASPCGVRCPLWQTNCVAVRGPAGVVKPPTQIVILLQPDQAPAGTRHIRLKPFHAMGCHHRRPFRSREAFLRLEGVSLIRFPSRRQVLALFRLRISSVRHSLTSAELPKTLVFALRRSLRIEGGRPLLASLQWMHMPTVDLGRQRPDQSPRRPLHLCAVSLSHVVVCQAAEQLPVLGGTEKKVMVNRRLFRRRALISRNQDLRSTRRNRKVQGPVQVTLEFHPDLLVAVVHRRRVLRPSRSIGTGPLLM